MKPRRVVFVLTVCLFSVAASRADDVAVSELVGWVGRLEDIALDV